MSSPRVVLNAGVCDGEPPSMASPSRSGPGRGGGDANIVDADVVYADEGTAKSVSVNLSQKKSMMLKTK
jgi:hypothetical protein